LEARGPLLQPGSLTPAAKRDHHHRFAAISHTAIAATAKFSKFLPGLDANPSAEMS